MSENIINLLKQIVTIKDEEMMNENESETDEDKTNENKYRSLILKYYSKQIHDAVTEFNDTLNNINKEISDAEQNPEGFKELFNNISNKNKQEGEFYRLFGPYLSVWSVINQ